MPPHDPLFPGFYYVAQAFDYVHESDTREETLSHIESLLYRDTHPTPPVLHDHSAAADGGATSPSQAQS